MMLYNCITQYCVTCFLDCAMLHHVMLHFILLFLVSHSVSHCITYTKMGQLLWRIVSCYTRHCIYHISFKTYMLRLDISWYYFAWYSVPLLKHKCIISCVYSRTHAQCHMNVWCELTLICHESTATLWYSAIRYNTIQHDMIHCWAMPYHVVWYRGAWLHYLRAFSNLVAVPGGVSKKAWGRRLRVETHEP